MGELDTPNRTEKRKPEDAFHRRRDKPPALFEDELRGVDHNMTEGLIAWVVLIKFDRPVVGILAYLDVLTRLFLTIDPPGPFMY
jgi:hypothetical protein